MTDITELAQRMSIERIKQIALGSTPTMGERESLAITALHFAEELKIATDAFQAAGLAQLAAEEALEKAQGMEAYWKTQCRGITDHCEGLQACIAELEEAEQKLCAANVTLDARAELAERQLAEMESRTVTVKLSSERFRYGESDYDDGYVNGWNARMAEDTAALDRVGIKWEAE